MALAIQLRTSLVKSSNSTLGSLIHRGNVSIESFSTTMPDLYFLSSRGFWWMNQGPSSTQLRVWWFSNLKKILNIQRNSLNSTLSPPVLICYNLNMKKFRGRPAELSNQAIFPKFSLLNLDHEHFWEYVQTFDHCRPKEHEIAAEHLNLRWTKNSNWFPLHEQQIPKLGLHLLPLYLLLAEKSSTMVKNH